MNAVMHCGPEVVPVNTADELDSVVVEDHAFSPLGDSNNSAPRERSPVGSRASNFTSSRSVTG